MGVERERQFYVGDDTLSAAMLREMWLRERLPDGKPKEWLAAMLGAVMGRKLPGVFKQAPDVVQFARGLLSGLGLDPDTHEVSRVDGQWKGLQIRDQDGKPVKFITEKSLKKLMNDPLFLSGFGEEAGG